MPVHAYTIKAGSTGRSFLVFARGDDGVPLTGLAPGTDGATAAYTREGDRGAVPVQLTEGRVGRYGPGSFVEVDGELMPGVYQFGAPDEMLASGSTRAVLVLRFPRARIDPIDVDLVAFDPQNDDNLGLSALGPAERLRALRGAFPLVAAKDIREREALLEAERNQTQR